MKAYDLIKAYELVVIYKVVRTYDLAIFYEEFKKIIRILIRRRISKSSLI
ncbi:hypothetical protein HMPREF3229_00304 [Peptoniphilus harei]|uniref:Uncharacterized protein n=1 Tax=Peptoniphilus harei TaxID=54005 RepID=A0A133PRY5_9FIRM|nr:hypothetical protein HMPREF3229_00304 [Peptoniphilus harei]